MKVHEEKCIAAAANQCSCLIIKNHCFIKKSIFVHELHEGHEEKRENVYNRQLINIYYPLIQLRDIATKLTKLKLNISIKNLKSIFNLFST